MNVRIHSWFQNQPRTTSDIGGELTDAQVSQVVGNFITTTGCQIRNSTAKQNNPGRFPPRREQTNREPPVEKAYHTPQAK